MTIDPAVTAWLLEGDPAVRWQAMRDLLGEPADVVDAERARVATEGWGARLLDLQGEDGQWDGGTYVPGDPAAAEQDGQPWTATAWTLQLLRVFGLRPDAPRAQRAVALVAENSRWEHDGQRFFDGEVEPCITVATTSTAGRPGQPAAGAQSGSRPVCPSTRSNSGASPGTGTRGAYRPPKSSGAALS